jgi:hypothetical protein
MSALVWCALVALSIGAVVSRAVLASAMSEQVPSAPDASRTELAARAMARASDLRLALRGLRGKARLAAVDAAVAAYRAIRREFPEERLAVAEAAFRAGELLRSTGDGEGALAEFTIARDGPGRGPFRVRALLEIGHVHRREGRHGAALDAYLAASTDAAAAVRWREEASVWAGRVYAAQSRWEDARRVLEPVALRAEDPLQRIDAFDELALVFVSAGDLEAAAGELARCREALADASLEESDLGERVRGALQRMRSIARLEQAIAARVRGVRVDRAR